ncbi:hypothetical protein [Flyfo microvirus Tbat2_158]|nr:hypothetical protein [Flyfo microvirus Tbat2_158]
MGSYAYTIASLWGLCSFLTGLINTHTPRHALAASALTYIAVQRTASLCDYLLVNNRTTDTTFMGGLNELS